MAAAVVAKRLRSRVEVVEVAVVAPVLPVAERDQAVAQALAAVEVEAAAAGEAAAVVSAAALLPAAARLRLPPLPLPLGFQRAGPNQ